jgi:hypothetical protein
MGPSILAQNVVATLPTLRRESDTERGRTDTCHITPKNTLQGRRSTGRKGRSRGLAKLSQTRAIVSSLKSPLLRTLHRVSLQRHPNSPKSPTMMTSGRCPSTLPTRTFRNHCLLRMFRSSHRLRLGQVMIPPTLFKLFRQRYHHNRL